MKISARLLAMAEDEMIDLVPTSRYRKILKQDDHPLFKAFVIGQEGEATPSLVGVGQVVTRWFKSAVEKLTDKLGIGTKVFHLHDESNSQDGRTPVGEVVGKTLRNIQGFLSSVAVTYIYPQFRDLPLDVASIEADVKVPSDARKFDVEDVDVLEVTGIALGNSAVNKPAFPRATLIAQLQAFAETDDRHKGGENNMTLEDIKKAVQEGKFQPSDIFQPAALTADPFIKEHVKEETNNLKGYQIRKLADAETKVSQVEAEKKALQDKVGELTKSTLRVTGKETFTAILKERKLVGEDGKPKDEKLVKFLSKGFEKNFSAVDEASLKKDLNTFLDVQVEEFHDLMGDVKPDGNGVKLGVGADDRGTGDLSDEDLMKPENNPLIIP